MSTRTTPATRLISKAHARIAKILRIRGYHPDKPVPAILLGTPVAGAVFGPRQIPSQFAELMDDYTRQARAAHDPVPQLVHVMHRRSDLNLGVYQHSGLQSIVPFDPDLGLSRSEIDAMFTDIVFGFDMSTTPPTPVTVNPWALVGELHELERTLPQAGSDDKCTYCGGSGKCSSCGGNGCVRCKLIDGKCAFCQGTGRDR